MKTYIISKNDIACQSALTSTVVARFKKPISFISLHVNGEYLCLINISEISFMTFSDNNLNYETYKHGIRLFLNQSDS